MEQSHRGRCSRHVSALVALLAGVIVALASASPALAVGDANEVACPNEAMEGFREYLPDCRAYEMVSPPYKEGFELQSISAIAAEGGEMLAESTGAFAGAGSDFLQAFYRLSRSGSGWTVEAVDPAASLFPAYELMASSDGLASTVWALREASQSIFTKNLYLREGDGALVEIGPMVPPAGEVGPPAGGIPFSGRLLYKYAGASADLSRVLFTVNNAFGGLFWPEDTTVEGQSLYEYAGTGRTRPALVGVSDGSTVVGGEALPDGGLISSCSTYLGSEGSRDVYNAVSATGEVVFFTARGHTSGECGAGVKAPAVSELYARVDGSETVAVSEPTVAQCLTCKTGEGERRPAEFQGASRDGSKVFFLTTQELFAGDQGTNLYEYDFENRPGHQLLRVSTGSATPEVQGVVRVSEDGSHVYFVAKGVLTQGPDAEGDEPVPGGENLYVFERDAAHPTGRVAFIATLEAGDAADWSGYDDRPAQATPDGAFLVFESSGGLTGGPSGVTQVFEYDAESEELVRVSVGQTGYAGGTVHANAHAATMPVQQYQAVFAPALAQTGLAVSGEGSTVLFTSAAALTAAAEPAEAANAASVYEYRSDGAIGDGNVYLISDGQDTIGAAAVGTDESGRDIFFQTAQPLLSQDGDTQFDIYDAREEGGFAPSATSSCLAEGCQGPAVTQPVFGTPVSATIPGARAQPPIPPPLPSPSSTKQVKPLTRAQRLTRALRVCRRKRDGRRRACEVGARRRYGPVGRAKKASHSSSRRSGR
jgi:hypothetical protein